MLRSRDIASHPDFSVDGRYIQIKTLKLSGCLCRPELAKDFRGDRRIDGRLSHRYRFGCGRGFVGYIGQKGRDLVCRSRDHARCVVGLGVLDTGGHADLAVHGLDTLGLASGHHDTVKLLLICCSPRDGNVTVLDGKIDIKSLKIDLSLFHSSDNGIGDLAIPAKRRPGSTGGQRSDRHAQKESSHGYPPTICYAGTTALWSHSFRTSAPASQLTRRLQGD